MNLRSCIVASLLAYILGYSVASSAAAHTLEDCMATPEARCVTVIVNQLLGGLEGPPKPANESEHVNRIANMLAHTPHLDSAEKVAAHLPDQLRESVLATLAVRHAILGTLDETRRLMQMVHGQFSRDNIRLEIVKTEMKNSNEDAAWAIVAEIETADMRDDALRAMADIHINRGEFDATIELSRSASKPAIQAFILGRVILNTSKPDQVEEAISMVERIEDPTERIKGLVQLTRFLAVREQQATARGLFAKIEKEFSQLQVNEGEKQSLRETINGRLIELGFLDLAIPALAQTQNLDTKLNLLTYLAFQFERKGEIEKAEMLFKDSVDLAGTIADPRERDEQLVFVLSRLSNTNISLREQAPTFTSLIEDPKRRGKIMQVIARKLATLGQFGSAERLLRPVDDQAMRFEGLLNLAWMLAQKEHTEQAEAIFQDIVAEIESKGGLAALHFRTRQHVIITANKLGAFKRAHYLASKMKERDARVIAFLDIAIAAIEAGDPKNGRAWLYDAVREADKVVDGERRTDLIYRLGFGAERIGGLPEISTILQIIEDDGMRQLFLYEVARNWLNVEGRRDDARRLVDRFGSKETKKMFRERAIEVALMKSLLLEGQSQ